MVRSPKRTRQRGFPPATYYIFVQSPGDDGVFNMDLQSSGVYSGDVVNTQTGALLFNFTGTGSVQDAAASTALSDTINQQGFDDVYTKLTFQLVAAGTTPTEMIPTSPVSTDGCPDSVAWYHTVPAFDSDNPRGALCSRTCRCAVRSPVIYFFVIFSHHNER